MTTTFLRPSLRRLQQQQMLPHHHHQATTNSPSSPSSYRSRLSSSSSSSSSRRNGRLRRIDEEPTSPQSYLMGITLWVIIVFVVWYHRSGSSSAGATSKRIQPPTNKDRHRMGKLLLVLEKAMFDEMDERLDLVARMRRVVDDPTHWIVESPVHQGMWWMASHDSYYDGLLDTAAASLSLSNHQQEQELLQRYAIVVLYYYTDAKDEWIKCAPAKSHQKKKKKSATPCDGSKYPPLTSSQHVCDWFGITCNHDKHVTRIEWTSNGLSSSADNNNNNNNVVWPEEMILLEDTLELLWWSGNPHLEMTLPVWLGRFTALQSLSLFATRLQGTLPEELYTLSNLKSLRIYEANVRGGLSTHIGQLSNLSWLWVHSNQLTGAIPSEIGLLTNLEGLTGEPRCTWWRSFCQVYSWDSHCYCCCCSSWQ